MKTFLIASILLILTGCTKIKFGGSRNIDKCENTCPNEGICTDIFLHAKLKITYTDGSTYKLDSFKTIRSEDNKLLDPAIQYVESGWLGNGYYPVFNDNFKSLTNQCGKEFYFIGYKDNIQVVKEKYVFSHDCCHMIRISGKTSLTIE